MNSLLLTATCAASAGCFTFAIPPTSQERLQAHLDAANARVGAMEKNNALAVAKDRYAWSNQGAYGYDTIDEAVVQALTACNESAKASGFESPCVLYSINGIVVK